jgi:hypothetical protein
MLKNNELNKKTACIELACLVLKRTLQTTRIMKTTSLKNLRSALVAAFALAVASLAQAIPTAGISVSTNGGATTIFLDNGAGDSAGALEGFVNVNYSDAAFIITSESLTSKPLNGNGNLPRLLSNLSFTAGTGGTLEIRYSDVGFTGPAQSAFLTTLASVVLPSGATLTYQSYYNSSNSLFDLSGATLLGTVVATSSGAPTGHIAWSPLINLSAPYALTQVITVTGVTVGSESGGGQFRLATPDGGMTVVLLGMALLGLEVLRRRMLTT